MQISFDHCHGCLIVEYLNYNTYMILLCHDILVQIFQMHNDHKLNEILSWFYFILFTLHDFIFNIQSWFPIDPIKITAELGELNLI